MVKMERRIKRTMLTVAIFLLAQIIVVTLNVNAMQVTQGNNGKHFLIVDKNNENCYKTIQEAIDNVSTNSTIYIKKGEYSEVLYIKKTITLIGEDRDATLIKPVSGKNKYAIYIGVLGVTIENLSIINKAPGLYTTGLRIAASNTKIYNCNIYNTPIGITIWTSNNSIENCKFWNCKDEGIALVGSSYSKCENNRIINCTFYENTDGIELQYASHNIISRCMFFNNTHSGIDAIAKLNNDNTISNCKIYNNVAYGIYLSDASNNKIINCVLSNNPDGNLNIDKNSNNNQIITNNNIIEEKNHETMNNGINKKTSKRNILLNFFTNIYKTQFNRINKIFEILNF
ncbi:MAG: hypothetical protein DRN24_00410 [Thermoplasmata archaeon]|nr:MAG: hypothetical protein DRN24_00410 [Thermoplasmata archaeon]